MARIRRILFGLALLVSMGLGAVAHASEQTCIPGVDASAIAGHADGDADQVPADSGNGCPYHHGRCYGHHVAAPLERTAHAPCPTRSGTRIAGTTVAIACPALRPPIA